MNKKKILGTLYYLAAMFMCVMLNILMKRTINTFDVPILEILSIRQFIIVLCLIPLMIKNKFNFFNKQTIKPNVFRNVIFVLSLFLMYQGIKRIPLNDSTTMSFLTPIFGCVLATKLLGEKSSKMLWVALTLSMVGVFVVNKPSFDDEDIIFGYGLLFISVLIRGYIVVLNKKLAQSFDTMTILFYTHIVIFLVSSCFFMQFKTLPLEAFGYIICIALLFFFEYLLIFKAYKYVQAIYLQPLEFSRIIFMMILSYLIMGEQTTTNQILGGVVVIFGYSLTILDDIIKKRTEEKK